MMIFETTSKSLRFKLQGAITTNALVFTCSWVDIKPDAPGVPGTFTGTSNSGLSNNTTGVILMGAPAAGYTRQLKTVSLLNLDTINATVTIYELDGADIRPIMLVNLDVGDHLHYIDSSGWKVITSLGSEKVINPGTVTDANNVGAGAGFFKILNGTILDFKTLVLGSNKLIVTNNTNDLTLDVQEANIDINALGGSPLDETKGGTGQTTVSVGDILYGSASNVLSKLPLGSSLEVLRVNGAGTQIEWATSTAFITRVYHEVPTGVIDGVNAVFTLANAPNPSDNLDIFKAGLLQYQGIDYTLAGVTITFTAGNEPKVADNVICNYFY